MGKIRLKGSKIQSIESGTVNPIHEIPSVNNEGGVEEIDLSILEGWDDLTVEKQRYLVEFSKSKLKRKRAALNVGISTKCFENWKQRDQVFSAIYNDIIDLHTEGVEEVDYLASFTPSNNTSRGRFLNKRSKIYKDDEPKPKHPAIGTQNNQTNILAILNSKDVTEKGLAGVQQVFNKLKDEGRGVLPEKSVD